MKLDRGQLAILKHLVNKEIDSFKTEDIAQYKDLYTELNILLSNLTKELRK